jgi:hypothetical protein
MNLENEMNTLVENIRNTNDVKKLEYTISMLCFGLVMDTNHEEDYINLINLSVERLKLISLTSGNDHPLCHMDVVNEREKIERSVMMSVMLSIRDSEKQKEELFDIMCMN